MPKDPRTLIQQGLAAQRAGRLSEAADCYTTILKADPTYFDALQLLGILRFREGKLAEGLDLLERALRITATHGPTLNNYGNVLRQMGRHQEALRAYRAALQYLPAPNALLLRNLGSVLLEIGEQEEAGRHLEHSCRLDPTDPVLWCWIGMLESMRKRLDVAGMAYLEAQRLDVAHGDAWFQAQLGLAANANGARQYGVAEQQFAMILEARPTVLARISRLQLAQRLVRWARWQHDIVQLHIEVKEAPADHEALMQVLYLTDDLSVLRSCTEAVARFHAQRTGSLSAPTARRRVRPRVGYLSGDMRNHVVAWLFAEILEQRDRERFEVFVYALGTTDDSEVRQRICAEADHFVEIGTPSYGAIYAQIVADEIDILVDVAGYTEYGRPRVLAMRPAPVQVGWLGYPGSMGGTMLDYLIADAVVVPPELESSYSEQIVRLPNSCLPNHSQRRVAAPLSREQLGLPADAIVLCAFVPAMKITPPMFALWMHVMTERPNSCLWLQQPSEEAQVNLRREALNAGVDGARLIFAGMEPDLADHLARYLVADIALDTFPYGSHSTAADALWVGCPLISRLGKGFAARVSSSVLTAAGLPELVADTDAHYRQLIVQLIDDAPRRMMLRARLIENRDRSPLFDAAVYARHLEAAFTHMQTQALAGHTPASFDLPLA